MIINLEGVEVEDTERVYIKREGVITLKAVKVTEHTSRGGYPAFKVHFQDREGHFAIDEFVVTDSALWRIKMLTKAFKLPNTVDTNLVVGRYVTATFKAKATQGGGQIFEIKKYEPSKLTNTYEAPVYQAPAPTYHDHNNNEISREQFDANNAKAGADLGIDNDEIPF